MRFLLGMLILLLWTSASYDAFDQDGNAQAVLIESGQAFHYADQLTGRLTANGERYSAVELTGAHRTLPLGSSIRVRNKSNGRTVVVRVNDRGPYVPGRILDLSAAAADSLRMDRRGPTDVELFTVTGGLPEQARAAIAVDNRVQEKRKAEEKESKKNKFTVQLGSFSDIQAATEVANSVDGAWIQATRVDGKMYFRVNLGVYEDRENAEKKLKELREREISGFVKTLEEATS